MRIRRADPILKVPDATPIRRWPEAGRIAAPAMSVRVYQDWRIHPRYRHLILKPVAYVGHCDQGVVDVPGNPTS